MSRMTVTGTIGAMLTVVLIACSRPSSPAETQAGAASDLNRPPQAGAAPAKCTDLPLSTDLKKWLRAAPGVEVHRPLQQIGGRSVTAGELLTFIVRDATGGVRAADPANAHIA